MRNRAWIVLVALTVASSAGAQVPGTTGYQGLLLDASGAPVNGPVDLTMRLFPADLGGALLWEETHAAVPVVDGVYSVVLGETTPLTQAILATPMLYLEIVAGGETLQPRQRIVSVPYAVRAGVAVDVVDGTITAAKLGEPCGLDEVLIQTPGGWACGAPPAGPQGPEGPPGPQGPPGPPGTSCNPGDFLKCFAGPPGSIGVGECRSGNRFCNADGMGFGACVGSVVPATEVCDGLDNDCDGQGEIGAVDGITLYRDDDGDGFGETADQQVDCVAVPPWVTADGDCNDTEPTVFPGAGELCDGVDNDCNGLIDDSCGTCSPTEQQCLSMCLITCGEDLSCVPGCVAGCGLTQACGDVYTTLVACVATSCSPNEPVDPCARQSCPAEYVALLGAECTNGEQRACGSNVGECSEGVQTCSNELWGACVGSVDPTPEICDGLDNDCDAETDEEGDLFYADGDGDGFGDPAQSVNQCSAPPGFVSDATDCNDGDSSVNPGAAEICDDGIDNDCDGIEPPTQTWYRDADGDGYGDDFDTLSDCIQPAGYIDVSGDCDDTEPASNPGAAEVCDGVDNNCDGTTDEGLPLEPACLDSDGDGFGDPNVTGDFCMGNEPAGYVFDCSDCNDTESDANPGATEVCSDLLDNDCDGQIDCADGDCFVDPVCL